MLTGKYERFQAVLVSNLRAWWSNVTAVLAIPTGVTPAGWRGEAKWKSSPDLWGARSGIPRLSSKLDVPPTDAALHNGLFLVWCSSVECKPSLKSIQHHLTRAPAWFTGAFFSFSEFRLVFPTVRVTLRWLPLLEVWYAADPLFRGAKFIQQRLLPLWNWDEQKRVISLSNKHRSFEMESFVPS